MSRALALAELGRYSTSPNPRVGCVIVRDNQIIGEGWHQKVGGPHAEVLAVRDAQAKGHDVAGATAYVTLEPCSHFGRTPPCADLLVREKLHTVIAAMEDPNPLVNGQGFDKLRAVGIEVRCGLLEKQAKELNPGFISRVTRNRPYVRLKVGASLDGRVALQDGRSQWITSEAARQDGHHWRAQSCVILTGIGTVREDDPLLNIRGVATDRLPLRVVLDSAFEINEQARIFSSGPVLVIVAIDLEAASDVVLRKLERLRALGAEVVAQPGAFKEGRPKTDLKSVMRMLNERGFSELHVEAGGKLNASLLQTGLVDELLLYVAPSLIGAGRPFADIPEVESLDRKLEFRYLSVDKVGEDIRLRLRPKNSFMD